MELPVPEPLAVLERRHIHAVLAYCKGNKIHAAKLLGIARSSLYRKLAEYEVMHKGK